MRKTVSLNHDWYYCEGFKKEYLSKDFDETFSKLVNIPHTMKEIPYNYFNDEIYQMIGTYRKTITITKDMIFHDLIVRFYGVMNIAKIYINDKLVLTHEGGYTPFDVNLNKYVKLGDNHLTVVCDSAETKDIPPYGKLVDYLSYSGIYREVSLLILPKDHLVYAHLFADELPGISDTEMILVSNLKMNQKEKEYNVEINIFDQEKKLILNEKFKEKLKEENEYTVNVKNIKRWNVDDPNLYDIEISISDNKKVIDIYKTKFGFRSVAFSPQGFVINNQPTKLIGLNRHQSYPYVGYAMPKRIQAKDADILKELGCNIVRTSHYMQSDHFIDRCDEIGLLVFEEIPGWNYIGNEHFKELSYENLRTMISHHFNHPSIILWGTRINESKDDHEFYTKTNEIAKKLDPSRQTGGVRNIENSELLEDVYTYNDFSHVGDNPGLLKPRRAIDGKVPYLVTEHNGHVFPTKKTDSESRRIEHAIRHLNVIEYAFKYEEISGAIGWCMADYNTHFQFGSNDRICHHGVLDMFRLPKYAAYVYKSQRNDVPVLEVASNMMSGDYDLLKLPKIVIFTNCDYVKIYRNDELIDTYYSEWMSYPDIPYAPVIVDDLIGEILQKKEKYKPKDAKKIKDVLLAYNRYGFKMPLRDKLKVLNLMSRKVLDMNDAILLFEKYLGNQIMEPTVFRFEGYIDDKLVIKQTKGQIKKSELLAISDDNVLEHGFTYDATRIVVKQVDEFKNVLNYGNETITLKTDEHLEVIGPKNLSLIGGSIGVYVKTTGVIGKAKVKIESNNYEPITINIEIKKGILEV